MRANLAVAVGLSAALSAAGCSRTGDENLGLKGKPGTFTVDVAQLARPGELVRAAFMPSREIDQRLGPHRIESRATLKVEPPGKPAESLDETWQLDSDAQGAFRAVHESSRGYGYEAALVGGELYVRPRWGKFVKRKPEGDEADRLRAAVETAGSEYLKLLERFIVVREDGRTQVHGRSAVKLKLAASPSPTAAPAEAEPGKKWRESMAVRYIEGDAYVDAASGALLGLHLDAAYSFVREKSPFVVTVSFKQTAASPETIVAPADAIDSPHRTRPMLDRAELLEGLK